MAEHTEPGTLGSPRSTTGTAGTTSGNSIVGRVREQATSQLNTQKNKATEGLGSVAHAVRGTTQRLREEQHDTVARYVDQAADQIERFSERLKQKDVGELMSDAQRLARRRPALFIGGAFAIGLLGARFLKSSAEQDRDYRTGYSGGGTAYRGTDYTSGSNYGGADYGSAEYGTDPARARVQTPGTTTNAYGNRVPDTARTASERPRSGSTSRGTGYGPAEEL